jgi:hypothetical protein
MVNSRKSSIVFSVILVAGICCAICSVGRAQVSGNLPPELQDIVKLSQAQVPDDVITAHIKSSGTVYHLNADEIIYLRGENVSQAVITALVQAEGPAQNPPPAPTPSPTPAAPAAPQPAGAPAPQPATPADAPPSDAPAQPEVNFDYFHDQLAPFGTWIEVGGTMYWRPDRAIAANPDWRPYYDNGQWTHTDNGLFWQSDYSWGDIPFHYGRWVQDPAQGWLWAPDYTWGPAWVFWRHAEADACIGWAPLPVGAVFVDGGFMFNGVVVGPDYDFGYPEDRWTFIGYDHFHEDYFRLRGREYVYHIDRYHVHAFYGRSVVRNEFHRDAQGRFVNEGIGKDRVAKLTKVQDTKFEERNAVGDRNKLAAERAQAPGKPGADRPGGAKPTDKPDPQSGHPAGTQAPPARAAAPVSKVYRPPVSQSRSAAPAARPMGSSGSSGGRSGGSGKK